MATLTTAITTGCALLSERADQAPKPTAIGSGTDAVATTGATRQPVEEQPLQEQARDPSARPRPDPTRIPAAGSGRFEVAPLSRHSTRGSVGDTTYRVEVEQGLPFDLEATAALVDDSLHPPRGWTSVTGHTFTASTSSPEIRILIATPATTDRLCAPLITAGEVLLPQRRARGHQRHALGERGDILRDATHRLPPLRHQSRGRARHRLPARKLPGPGRAGA